MSDAITIVLKGETIALPAIMNFEMLERAWPGIRAHAQAGDFVQQVSAACAVVAAVLKEVRPELNLPEIKKRLQVDRTGNVDERNIIVKAVDDLCRVSGLVKPGEEMPAENPPAAMGTTDQTSNT
jgi:hypothetical protein